MGWTIDLRDQNTRNQKGDRSERAIADRLHANSCKIDKLGKRKK